MKKAREICRRIARKIYTGLGLTTVALVFQACYGPPQAIGLDVLIRGVVKSKTTKAPIRGIRVSAKDVYQYDETDSSGKFQLYVPQEEQYVIQLEDIDGAENGSYSSREISVNFSENTLEMNDILLDESK